MARFSNPLINTACRRTGVSVARAIQEKYLVNEKYIIVVQTLGLEFTACAVKIVVPFSTT